MVLRSPVPDLVIPELSFAEYMLSKLKSRKNNVGIIDASSNKEYSYQEIHDNGIKCGRAFYNAGLRRGDVVATCLTNLAEYIFIVIGVNACSGTLTTTNPTYTKEEVSHQLKQTEPKFVFVNSENYEKVVEVCGEVPSVKAIINMEDEPNQQTFRAFMEHGNSTDLLLPVKTSPHDVAIILFSSGTTGLPKGVMLSHKNVMAIFTICDTVQRFSHKDVLYLVLPMFHIYGILMCLLAVAHESRVVIRKRFDFRQMLNDIQQFKITKFSAAPPIIVGLDQLPSNHGYDLSSLREVGSGAAPLPESVANSISHKYNIKVKQAWGLTEGPRGAIPLDDFTPINSVGSVTPNTRLKIVDPNTHRELEAYQDGEIWIKGPQVMKGYLKNPEATARTIDHEGWLHTGDIGHYDDHEFIYIVDRLKELIKYKGFQVAPAELEDALLRHPKIVDVGVIGVPDLEAGELPKAYIVRKDETLTEGEVHQFLKDKVAKFKYLSGGITFTDTIPKSNSGKILRRVLRKIEGEGRSPSSKM